MVYCSLGNSCMSAFTLKKLKLKEESYPFDWINSRSEIIKHCLTDNFKDFLDRSLYTPQENIWEDNDDLCQHRSYCPFLDDAPTVEKQIFFRHHDPLGKDEHYEYYVRCVERFKNLLSSDEEKIFIKTYPKKEESKLEDALDLNNFLKDYTTNYKVIAVKQSMSDKHSVKMEKHGNLLYAELTTIQDGNGAAFYNETDQSFVESVFQYLINNFNEIR